ncbi:MAG TPA: polysaccharide biosynthesis tyrosine autokinase [Nocardioides sp.]|uniref:polysaccharide biosynthesis tyrosine autokinase n=1 Tax=Nocardioides sp. TaxID=35761 RepID=UPI002E324BA4|nr:polysaccharide biosynthesis tyrosine autokinase [Nocardioides sp.]HEX3932287.1 polysaccharide biosynthesis tyrosine autokinase [Nocardioides sp.]
MEFKDYVRIVLAHWVGVLVLTVLGLAGAVGYNATQPQVYEASATGYVTAGNSDNTADATLADQLAKAKVTSYVAVATSTKVANRVIRSLGLQTSPGALIGSISVSQPTDTVLLDISARSEDPVKAQQLANAWVSALAAEIKTLDTQTSSSGTSTGTSTGTTSDTGGEPSLHIEVLSQAEPGALVLPRTKVNLVVGLLLGFLLGFAYALVRHQFDRRLRSSEEVERRFGTPVIGMIPRSSQVTGGNGVLALTVTSPAGSSNASTSEGFRKLRTNLAYMDVDHPPRVIVVTSPKQSDGKSTVAANLAAAIAIGGQPVTLVDGDLRRPSVAGSLAMVDGAGLTDVLVGRVNASEVMQDHPDVPGLRVLASGAIPPNPSELLGSNAMRTLIQELAAEAMVIIDAPPLLPVTDAAVLTRSADGALVVISHGGTLDSELGASLSHISAVHGRTLGIVFNRMRRSAGGASYGGDYYRYEYKPESGRRKAKPGRQKADSSSKS